VLFVNAFRRATSPPASIASITKILYARGVFGLNRMLPNPDYYTLLHHQKQTQGQIPQENYRQGNTFIDQAPLWQRLSTYNISFLYVSDFLWMKHWTLNIHYVESFSKTIKEGIIMKFNKLAISSAIILGSMSLQLSAATQWNVSLWGKPRAFTEHVEKLAQLVEQKTNGDFKLKLSYGGLSKNKENLDGISIGAFEMAQFCAGYHRDKNPSITVMELPFLGVSSLEQEAKISMALYQHPAVIKDLQRWNATLLMPSPLPQYNIIGVGDAPAKVSDFAGMRVRATGGIGKALASIKAVPTSVTATEVRTALDSGVVSAVAFAPHAHMAFGTTAAAKWWTSNLNPGTVNCPVVVNSDALAALSDSNKQALLGSVDEAIEHYIASYQGATMDKWGPLLKEKNINEISFSDAELAEFKKIAAAPIRDEWIATMSAKGLPAQELYDLVNSMIAK